MLVRLFLRRPPARAFHSHPALFNPNQRQNIDPSLQRLLEDVDLSLLKQNRRKLKHHAAKSPVELESVPLGEITSFEDADGVQWDDRAEKRSPEAVFGSKRIGMVTLPVELVSAVSQLVSENDKYSLRSDAKRLFTDPSSASPSPWVTQISKVNSKSSRRNHTVDGQPQLRENLAVATVAMPAHYAAIYNVLQEVRGRLGEQWSAGVESVVEFGVGSGAGVWATLQAFSNPPDHAEPSSTDEGTIRHYLAIDNRSGLVSMSQKLLRNSPYQNVQLAYEKFWGKEGHTLPASSRNTMALSAFTLSSLKDDTARRIMLREMWDTGAEVMVILDHGTTEGFQSIVIARDYLLRKGKKQLATTQDDTVELLSETEDDISTKPASSTVGSHVVAPCPHDGPCPLSLPSALSTTSTASICHFSQRLSRPEYTRKTKHSNRGEEDMKYSYVVIRRGPRPLVSHPIEVAQAIPSPIVQRRLVESEASESEADDVVHLTWDESQSADLSTDQATIPLSERGLSRTDEDLRANSYHWPRIIYPPMKRSGHIILDTCTKEGNIARHTIPKSQGKQAYYDARKSSWGDSFPWEGKNGPQIRKIAQAVASTKRPFKKQATQA